SDPPAPASKAWPTWSADPPLLPAPTSSASSSTELSAHAPRATSRSRGRSEGGSSLIDSAVGVDWLGSWKVMSAPLDEIRDSAEGSRNHHSWPTPPPHRILAAPPLAHKRKE